MSYWPISKGIRAAAEAEYEAMAPLRAWLDRKIREREAYAAKFADRTAKAAAEYRVRRKARRIAAKAAAAAAEKPKEA